MTLFLSPAYTSSEQMNPSVSRNHCTVSFTFGVPSTPWPIRLIGEGDGRSRIRSPARRNGSGRARGADHPDARGDLPRRGGGGPPRPPVREVFPFDQPHVRPSWFSAGPPPAGNQRPPPGIRFCSPNPAGPPPATTRPSSST